MAAPAPTSHLPTTIAPAAPAPVDHDPARRAFFRQVGRQAVTTAGQVAGMADIVGRSTGGATAGLLGLLAVSEQRPRGAPLVARRATVSAGTAVAGVTGSDSVYRSPYRLEGDTLRILDQRLLPEGVEEVVARRGSDVVHYLRRGVFGGGPLLAQLAAYGQALTAKERAAQPPALRDHELARTRIALLEARPSSPMLRRALDRQGVVMAATDAAGAALAGPQLAEAMHREADAIAAEAQLGLAAIAETLATTMNSGQLAGRPLGVLVHGDPGALRGGLVGSGIAALRRLRDAGQELHVVVTEARPTEEGLRHTSWELRQAGIGHTVVPDAAVDWILEHEPIDVVLIGAECVAANGDSSAILGSRAIAQMAAEVRDARGVEVPRLIVTALTAAVDLDLANGDAMPIDAPLTNGQRDPRLLPASEVIASRHVSVLVTEHGVITPGSGTTLRDLVASASPWGRQAVVET